MTVATNSDPPVCAPTLAMAVPGVAATVRCVQTTSPADTATEFATDTPLMLYVVDAPAGNVFHRTTSLTAKAFDKLAMRTDSVYTVLADTETVCV
jgi:hypothetical protein